VKFSIIYLFFSSASGEGSIAASISNSKMERVIVNNGIYCYLWLDFWDSTVPMHTFPELSPLEYSAGNVFNPCAHSVFQIGLETDAWASRAGGFGGQHCSIDRLGCCVVGPVLLLGLCEPGLHREEKRRG
jgi:hypothetical protein